MFLNLFAMLTPRLTKAYVFKITLWEIRKEGNLPEKAALISQSLNKSIYWVSAMCQMLCSKLMI